MQSWLCVLELTAQVQLEMLNWASSTYRLSLMIIDTGALLGSVLSKKIRRVCLESNLSFIFREHLEEKKYVEEAKSNTGVGTEWK